MAQSEPNLTALLKAVAKTQKAKKKADAEASIADKEFRAAEEDLLLHMRSIGTTLARGEGLTVSLIESTVPQVVDWAELEKFVLRKKRLDIFQRRISVEPYRELLESVKGDHLPGCKSFTKWSLRITQGK